MADFHQNGVITTLHNLHNKNLKKMEEDLKEFSTTRPMALVLPSLYSELEGEALPNIVRELSKVNYLTEIVIGGCLIYFLTTSFSTLEPLAVFTRIR